MPTRKQRRRREKEKRHEYEYVYVDERGAEVEISPDELRSAKPDRKQRNGPRPGEQPKDRRGRPLRVAKPPSWRSATKRAVIFVAALAVFLSFFGGKNQSVIAKIVIPLGYGVIGIPFFYWMDRATYRRYLKATGREAELPDKRRR